MEPWWTIQVGSVMEDDVKVGECWCMVGLKKLKRGKKIIKGVKNVSQNFTKKNF